MNYRLASLSLRRAAGLILAAVAGRDLGGFFYPGGVVSYGTLLETWKRRGESPDEFVQAALALREAGKIRLLDEDLGLIVANVPSDTEAGDAEMDDRGGYYPEVVPLTTSRQADLDYDLISHESMLPVGLGGSSAYDWDTFDAWSLDDGQIHPKLIGTHLGRLLLEGS